MSECGGKLFGSSPFLATGWPEQSTTHWPVICSSHTHILGQGTHRGRWGRPWAITLSPISTKSTGRNTNNCHKVHVVFLTTLLWKWLWHGDNSTSLWELDCELGKTHSFLWTFRLWCLWSVHVVLGSGELAYLVKALFVLPRPHMTLLVVCKAIKTWSWGVFADHYGPLQFWPHYHQ